MEPARQSKALKWSLIIAIIVVLNLFFNYALSLAYPSPDYNTFCPQAQINNPPETQTACLKVGGQWTVNPSAPEPASVVNGKTLPVVAPTQTIATGYCDPTYTCGANYTSAMNIYDRNIFIALISLGIISILIGLFWRTTDAVSIGLSFGGVISLIIGSGRYWSAAGNILKVIILAIALIALVWVGVKKFSNETLRS